MELLKRPAGNVLLAGTGLGLLILGVGGRLAMAAIQVHASASPRFSLGGTMTVVSLGAPSGFAGAVLMLLSRAVGARVRASRGWSMRCLPRCCCSSPCADCAAQRRSGAGTSNRWWPCMARR